MDGRITRIPARDDIRIATWNILNRKDDYRERIGGIASALAEARADVAALQEVRLDCGADLTAAMEAAGYSLALLEGSENSPIRGTDMEPVSEGHGGCGVAFRRASEAVWGHIRKTAWLHAGHEHGFHGQ